MSGYAIGQLTFWDGGLFGILVGSAAVLLGQWLGRTLARRYR